MTKKLSGKVALVTGGSRGIGAASARALADEGANVAISYVASPDKAEAVVAELKAKGVEARAYKADQASSAEVEQLVKNVAKDSAGSTSSSTTPALRSAARSTTPMPTPRRWPARTRSTFTASSRRSARPRIDGRRRPHRHRSAPASLPARRSRALPTTPPPRLRSSATARAHRATSDRAASPSTCCSRARSTPT